MPQILIKNRKQISGLFAGALLFSILVLAVDAPGQTAMAVELGSRTAKAGFKNENEIRDKFNNWQSDADAQAWLEGMGYKLNEIEAVRATKPHGEKSDVVVRIRLASQPTTRKGGAQQSLPTDKQPVAAAERVEGISIKLVSSANGFNQIDKRWLSTYARKWKMPDAVVTALKLYLGEVPPNKPSRNATRMFLDELDPEQQKAVIDFFTANKEMIVSDIIEGDGADAAKWMMVAYRAADKPRWVLRSSAAAVRLFGEGKVEMTRSGNLKIGRITMQRKGGDGGRETANQLQFKINPVQLFD